MKLTLLGTGTSQGVPVIGCTCAVCTSHDPRDQRLRSSALFSDGDRNILIDAGPDFRQQMLRAKIDHLDAILITHEHNDHVIGMDDIRPFNFRSGQAMSVYALPRVANEIQKRFEYVFAEYIPGLPQIELISIDDNSLVSFGPLEFRSIGIMHGKLPILGYRCGDMTYLTDVKSVPDTEIDKIRGTRMLVTSALQHIPHPTHMSLSEALEFVDKIKPEHCWLTHISHHMGLMRDMEKQLPPGVSFAYDGLEIEW